MSCCSHSETASTMRTVSDPADFLGNPLRYRPCFNLTSSTLAQFSPNNSIIFLGTHKIKLSPNVSEMLNITSNESPSPVNNVTTGAPEFPWPELEVIEPLYLTPFHQEAIPEELINYWQVTNDVNIRLPAKNQYIPSDFTIINKSAGASDHPTRLSNTDNSAVSAWWLLDTQDFPEPRVNVECLLNNTNASISPSWEGNVFPFVRRLEVNVYN